MSSEEELENQAFKVQDRRRFHPDGSPVEGSEPAEKANPPQATAEKADSPPPSPTSAAEERPRDIPADFASLVLSLAAGAQSSLGISPHPLTGKPEKNLPQAKYSIDLLGMLQEKTRGNLGPEEAKLLEALLFDLRMRYVEANAS
ncbi:MAG: DUF1844 domain-containing protein [Deltaproteobacteria bacterium]|nr:DUF1844 domain-containing protein [Deltaproteobacteria bacterium]